MPKLALLTSFSVWKAQQQSNSSDELLVDISRQPFGASLHLLRHLPVNLPVAKALTIAKINQLKPQVVLCCGMAESRSKLNVESRAVVGNQTLETGVDLGSVMAGLSATEISHDAGRFVCNGLYYAILNYLQNYHSDTQCLFVHVPILTLSNRKGIVTDFCSILETLTA